MTDVVIGLTALNRRLTSLATPEAKLAYMGRYVLRTVAQLKEGVPRATGTTGRTIQAGMVSELRGQVMGSVNLVWLDQGTRPHEIRPRTRKALRFALAAQDRRLSGSPRVGANVTFATVVHHPGTRPQPFIDKAIRTAAAKSGADEVLISRWNDAA